MYVLRQFLSICFLLVAGPDIVSAQTAGHRHFTVKDGLAGNHVYMTHQDKNGYIWIATTSGLSRFDGRHFQNYDYENGLPDNEVLFVTNDHANRIWIHSFAANNALSFIEKALPVKRYSLKAVNLSEQYYSYGNQTTYLTGFHSLVVVRGSHAPVWTQLPFDAGRVWETEDGLCYLSDGRSIFTIKDTVVRFLQQLTGYPASYSRMYYYKGLLYAVSGKTLQIFVYGQKRFRYIATRRFDAPINQVHVNKYGIWITYKDQQGGCLFTRDGQWSLQYRFALPGFIDYISDDAEGGVWLSSSDNGLFYMPAPDFVNYTIADGLASSVVSALEPVPGKKLWLGYNTGQAELVCYAKKTLRKERGIMVEQSSSNGFVMDIASADKYGIFLLSRKNFLQLRDKATYLKAPGVNKSISLLNDTVIGVGGWKYWLYHLNTKSVTEYPISRIYAQCADIHGNYWLGGMDGLYRIDGHTSGYQKLKALDGYKINALVCCKDYLWAGTQNNGLYLLRNGRIVSQLERNSSEGLASNTIKALAALEDRVYIGTNKGVQLIRYNYDLHHIDQSRMLNHDDGLISPEVNDLKLLHDTLFIATCEGFAIHHATADTLHPVEYTISDVSVTDLQSNRRSDTQGTVIPYSSVGVELAFNTAALRYAAEISYLYQLEGFDSRWKHTTGNTAAYTNLPPGKYVFVVKAADTRGNSSKPYRFAFAVKPALWQTMMFKCSLTLLLLLIAGGLFIAYHCYTKRKTKAQIMQNRIIAKARLEALRAQIKPHFVFNSMNAISDYLHHNRNEDAIELLQGFAGLIRKGLNIAAKDFTTIAEETAFLVQYLKLEQKKCDACFDFTFESAPEIRDLVIPSLLSQPFVENAVIHGVRNIKGRRGQINVTYTLNGKDLICNISDNGVGVRRSISSKRADSIGTKLSEHRINYFRSGMGIDIELSITDLSDNNADEVGTRVAILIKDIFQLQTNEDNAEDTHNR